MHVVLRRSRSDIHKDTDIDDSTLSRKTLQDHGASSVIWRVSHCRSTDVTFFVLESNELERLLVLPQQYLCHKIHWRSPQSNVNSLQVCSLLPLTSLEFGGQGIQRVPYINSSLESILSRSSLHHEGALSNVNKWNTLSITSSGQNPIVECEVPETISSGSDANSVEDMSVHDAKENRSTNRYSRKKSRKKGKRNRNLKCSNGNGLQSAVGFSITETLQQNIQQKPTSSSANICNSMMNDAMTMSSISLGSSSDERCGQRGCKSPIPFVGREVSTTGEILNSAGERNKCLRQHGRNLYVNEKKDKYFRRVPKDSNVYANSIGNQNSHARKERYQCIWQRVQKNDADVSNCELKKVNLAFSQFDDKLKQNPLKKKLPNPVDSITSSQSTHENQENLKVPKNLRRNKSPGSLQENKSQCQKGSPVNGACSNACLKMTMLSNDVFGSATQRACEKSAINAADSRTNDVFGSATHRACEKSAINAADSRNSMSSFRARCKERGVQHVSSRPMLTPEAPSCNLEATRNVLICDSSMNDQMVEHQFDSLSRSEKFHDQTEQQGEILAVNGEGNKMDQEVFSSCQIKHEHNAVPRAVSRPWMHEELKESEPPNCLSVAMLAELESWTSKNVMQEQLTSKCLAPVSSSVDVRVINEDQNVENIKALSGDTHFGKLKNMTKFFIPEAKSQTFRSLENDFRNISQAVNDAHKAQLASKAIEIGNGYPTAEFEKLLHSASPVLCPSVSIQTCQACFSSQATDAPLCRHEIPSISLGNLWQWYEKHGNYGLEVKAEDHRNARWYGMDRFSFRAYFVPYLSAIQLFKDHRTCPSDNDIRTMGSMDAVDCEMNKTSDSSPCVDLRSILSVLVPQSLAEDSSTILQKDFVSDSGSSSEYSNGDLHQLPVESKLSSDMELLFEYFESEQPQRRQPLFETIQKLVSGDGPSNCRSYGDPSILQSVSLHDLHPHSWFSVAWYPIYKIPDGNLRASFLTYHSLGHFIHSDRTPKASIVDASVVSPIVGLQSYNAQGECWFQPRHSADDRTEEFLGIDLHTVLRVRLRTLEQTASIMSRAVRKSGNDVLVNTHPDYEFFLSRRR